MWGDEGYGFEIAGHCVWEIRKGQSTHTELRLAENGHVETPRSILRRFAAERTRFGRFRAKASHQHIEHGWAMVVGAGAVPILHDLKHTSWRKS